MTSRKKIVDGFGFMSAFDDDLRSKVVSIANPGTVDEYSESEIRFVNEYGVRLLREDQSGSRMTFQVIAVNSQGMLDYDTPVSEDIRGFMDVNQAVEAIRLVASL